MRLAEQALEAEARHWLPPDGLLAARRDFFVAYAQTMCLHGIDQVPDVGALRAPHTIERARINGVLANSAAFARTFACPSGTPMASGERCEI